MLWILFSITVHLFHGVLLLFFMHNRLRFKPIHQKGDLLFLIIFTAVLSSDFYLPFYIPDTIGFLLFAIYAVIAVKDPFHLTLFWMFVFGTLLYSVRDISQFLLYSLPNVSANDVLFAQSIPNAAYTILSCGLLFLAVYLVSRFKRDFSRPSWSNLFLFLALILCIYAVEKLLFSIQLRYLSVLEETSSLPFLLAYIALYACTLFTIILFRRVSAMTEREMSQQAELDAMNRGGQHQQELEQLYDQLSIKQHDFKQHMQTLAEMVRGGGNENANAYLETYRNEVMKDMVFATGSPAVDALLTAKYLMIEKAGVDLHTTLSPLHQLPLSSTRFCTMLGNLLDNALEAIQRLSAPESPVIELRLLRLGEMLCVICSNPCDPSTIRRKEKHFLSSKPDPKNHSIGLRNIRRIVEDAEGRCEFYLDGDQFTAKILLPYGFPREDSIPSAQAAPFC